MVSSTSIRQLIIAGHVDQAAVLLGRHYALSGIVSSGEGRGRTLGCPTANLRLPPDRVAPADGIYAAVVICDQERHDSVAYIGTRPTFEGGSGDWKYPSWMGYTSCMDERSRLSLSIVFEATRSLIAEKRSAGKSRLTWILRGASSVDIMKQSEGNESLQPALSRSIDKMAWPPLMHRVVRTVRFRSLFQRGQHILVAISGGPDSVALLSILHRLRSSWKLTLSAVHCNYGLRGAESEEDQKFVEAFCQGLGVPLHVRRVECHTGGRKASLQAEARDLRYRVMQEIAEKCGADRIAIGHTADDQAETVLLWMLRGAGLTGLSGMPAFRDNKIIRPLYDIKRQEILIYLRHGGVVVSGGLQQFPDAILAEPSEERGHSDSESVGPLQRRCALQACGYLQGRRSLSGSAG